MLPPAPRLLALPPLAAFVAANLIFLGWALTRPSFLLVRVVYDADTLWFPALFALAAAGLLLMEAGRRRPGMALALTVLAALGLGSRVYATHLEPRRLILREASLPVEGLEAPVRLLHISDIQSDAIGDWEERIVETVLDLDPDLLIMTGDLLHPIPPATVPGELPKLAALLGRIDPPLGKFMADGDTDYWLEPGDEEVATLERLAREPRTLQAGGGRIHLLGLTLWESAHPDLAREKVSRWLEGIPGGGVTIVAGHRPDYAMGLEDLRVDLLLAGHTHGGQIRVPFYGPIITLSRVPKAWARGFRRIGQPWLNVSAGLGAEHTAGLPAIRINCPPEMTLITLVPAGNPPSRGASASTGH